MLATYCGQARPSAAYGTPTVGPMRDLRRPEARQVRPRSAMDGSLRNMDASMPATDASMRAMDATLSALGATMTAKAAIMSAKAAIMSAKAAIMKSSNIWKIFHDFGAKLQNLKNAAAESRKSLYKRIPDVVPRK